MSVITCEQNVLVMLSAETRELAAKSFYKATKCGAWIEFHSWGVCIGSIVEGADFGTMTYSLSYPFTPADFDARVKAIEAEAAAIWEWANVRKNRAGRRHAYGKTDAERGLDAPDVSFDFRHLDPDGRSS